METTTDATHPRRDQPHSTVIRHALDKRGTHSDLAIGASPFVSSLWHSLRLPSLPHSQRGLIFRHLLWVCIVQHCRGGRRMRRCPICPPEADHAAWQVLWLFEEWTERNEFVPRLSLTEIVELGWYAAARKNRASMDTRSGEDTNTGIIRLLRERHQGNFASLVRACPVQALKSGPPGGYSRNWYVEKKRDAIAGLCAHLMAGDERLTRDLRELIALHAPNTATLPPPAETDRQEHAAFTISTISTISTAVTETEAPAGDMRQHTPVARQGAIGSLDTPADSLRATMRPTLEEVRPVPAIDGSTDMAAGALPDPLRDPLRADPMPARASSLLESARTPHSSFAAPAASRATTRARRLLPRLAAVALLLLLMLPQAGRDITGRRTVSLAFASPNGWVITRQWLAREPRIFTVVDPRTGAWRPLWPTDQAANGERHLAIPDGQLGSPTSPAYAPANGSFAFISVNDRNISSIWIDRIMRSPSGWPMLAPPGPRPLVADCDGCTTLTWSASGRWLIYNTPHGLVARTLTSPAIRTLTFAAGDAWPSCAPGGDFLAYQQAGGRIIVLPAEDCLPSAHAWDDARYLHGYPIAWHPAWSADRATIAFVSSVDGQWSIFTAALSDLSRNPIPDERVPAQRVSDGRCTDPVLAPSGRLGHSVAIFNCDEPAPDLHHGTWVEASVAAVPGWVATADEGPINRDNLAWIPAL